MSAVKIIAIGDNVCDKYLSRGKMYPGGQCVNTCAYAAANGVPSAYLGKFGSDEVAAYNQKILHELGIDISHCRHFEGENGFAMVTLKGNDRVFLGSNKGGVAKEHSFDFTQEDLEYIKGFNLIYTNLNSYIEEDLPFLHTAGVPIAYDFSTRWTDAYLEKVCPYVTVAILSCAHLSAEDRCRRPPTTAFPSCWAPSVRTAPMCCTTARPTTPPPCTQMTSLIPWAPATPTLPLSSARC